MTKAELAKLLAVLAASYPKFEVDDLKVQVWHEMLRDLDYSVASMAIKKLIALNTFPPAIAEVRKAAAEITNPGLLLAPVEAWSEVQDHFRRTGSYRTPSFSNPLIDKAVSAMGGWVELCRSEEPTGVTRAHFLRIYEGLAESEAERIKTTALLEQVGTRPQLIPLKGGAAGES